jgi:hypothetical protein
MIKWRGARYSALDRNLSWVWDSLDGLEHTSEGELVDLG